MIISIALPYLFFPFLLLFCFLHVIMCESAACSYDTAYLHGSVQLQVVVPGSLIIAL